MKMTPAPRISRAWNPLKKIWIIAALLLGPTCLVAQEPFNGAASRVADPLAEQLVGGTLWLQSGEGRALCYQAYALARRIFDDAVRANGSGKGLAVVTDIDDTLVWTTDYTRRVMSGAENNEANWQRWVEEGRGAVIPGALDFLRHVDSAGGRIFYITNRVSAIREVTLAFLKKNGFPQAVVDQVLTRADCRTSSKESRRKQAEKECRVVLLLGDNLIDFADFFPSNGLGERLEAVDAHKDEFGKKFVLLPNPMYGDWERNIYGAVKELTREDKLRLRREALFAPDGKPGLPPEVPCR